MGTRNKLNTIELFAGVGGFRTGLEQANPDLFKVVWGNQWEPSRKAQDAFDCYASNFKEGIHSNEDITTVTDEAFKNLDAQLVVGGFPCQDYSVARSLSGEKGIQGKKGVLFWEIKRIIEATTPRYVLLENVDRLLKSPAKQRGRDFAVMLATFRDLGYKVEWRVLNAAEYGMAQRRRRVFIFATRDDSGFSKELESYESDDILFEKGFFAPVFPVKPEVVKNRRLVGMLPDDIVEISDTFSANFHNSGYMHEGSGRNTFIKSLVSRKRTRPGSGQRPIPDGRSTGPEGETLKREGEEFGATTGRSRRCGWFDAVGVRHAVRVNGMTGIALTKLDVLTGFKKIPICTAYRYDQTMVNRISFQL